MNKWEIVELVAAGMLATALFIAGNWVAGFAWITIGVLLLRVRELEKMKC
jgi:hypothetical protein